MNTLLIAKNAAETTQKIDWIELLDHNREDGDFSNDRKCRAWLGQLKALIAEELGSTPEVRLHSYIHADGTYLAIDVFDQSRDNYVSITVLLEQGHMDLHGPVENQFDITMPGIIDGLVLVSELLRNNLLATRAPHFVWAVHEDRPTA